MIDAGDVRKARILVVDDSAVNTLLLERILRSAGYTAVSSTTDPCAVVGLYREHRYDLIVLDLLMPTMDGFQVMQGLQEIETEGYLPVLVLTAQPGHKLRALQAGAKDFVSKPFDQVEVLTRIHNMLEVRLLLRESRNYALLLERYDQLTGLPNRKWYRELLAKVLERPEDSPWVVSVLFVAVDRFKSVNDAVGRPAGGAFLRGVSDRLLACVGPMDTVARLEGEEFGLIVLTARDDRHGAAQVARRLQEAFIPPLVFEQFEATVTVSVGIAVSQVDAADADTLMQHAQRAVHEVKRSGGDAARFYSVELNDIARETLDLENALRGALERNEFVLHYQPKIRVDSGEWTGAEALIRWNRPGHGLVPPTLFISALESTGLIMPVGAWVIEAACRQMGEWARAGLGDIQVAVNVSSRQFLSRGFVDGVARAIAESGIAPGSLSIEISESSLMSKRIEADNVLRELKALGVPIAIDDFGTGYSSLAYLRRFPIDTLKIDISFIRDITTSEDGAAIAVAIIDMARSLKMHVIAEGVETTPQLEWLRAHACNEIQGFLYSRPLCADDLARLRAESLAPAALETV
ncbi:MAG: putative bifunctional diguanylate cyclase/phosphodiesterase [Gemmatimonadaceae bacterium]